MSACCPCGTPIGPRSRTGLCRSCGCRKAFADPVFRAARAQKQRQSLAGMSDDERERRREQGRRLTREVLTGERWAKSQTREVRQDVGRQNTERTLGWCPPDRRDEYRRLRKSLRYSAAEARAIIEADLAAHAPAVDRVAPKLPRTFEEQLAAVRAGARLIEVAPLRRAAPDMTLGGVATGLL